MSSAHVFRFGVVAATAASGEEWAQKAQRIESLGYATLVMPDGLQHTLAPMPALAAAAAATTSLRLGTYVIANDYRNPVMLAKEAATLDLLSGGRLELGIGAGRPSADQDNRMLGIPFDRGGVRVARLEEALDVLDALLSGRPATAPGPTTGRSTRRSAPAPRSARGRRSWSRGRAGGCSPSRRARRTSWRWGCRPPPTRRW